MNVPIEIAPWIAVAIVALVTSGANKWIGWKNGDRYTGSAAIAFTGWLFFGYPGAIIGLAMLAWRFVGWFRALDMGKDQHSFGRDFLVMAATTAAPIAVFSIAFYYMGLGYQGLWSLSLAVLMPICYGVAMRVPPNKPSVPHISIAEFLAGAVFGTIGCAMILTA